MGETTPARSPTLDSLAIVAVWAALYVAGRGEGWLSGDSVRYASVAKDLADRGDWTDLRVAGDPYWNKPPLVFALTALSFRTLGEHRLAATLPSALFALGTMFLAGAIGRRFLGRAGGFVAAVVLGATPLFVKYGATLRLDAPLAFFVAAGIAAAEFGRERPRLLLLVGPSLGLGLLAKGFGALVPLGSIALLSALRRDAYPWNRAAFWTGLGIGSALAVPWYLAMAARHGTDFLARFFGREIADRFTGGFSSDASPLDYLVSLSTWGGQPWLLLAIAAGVSMRRRPLAGDREFGRFLVAWALPALAPLALLSPPYARYLLPSLPCLALLSARWIAPRLRDRSFPVVRAFVLLASLAAIALLTSRFVRVTASSPREIEAVAEIVRGRGPGVRVLGAAHPRTGRPSMELRAYLDFYAGGTRVRTVPVADLSTLSPAPRDLLVLHPRSETPPPSWRRIFDGEEYEVFEPAPTNR